MLVIAILIQVVGLEEALVTVFSEFTVSKTASVVFGQVPTASFTIH